jgi:hypothetical protein
MESTAAPARVFTMVRSMSDRYAVAPLGPEWDRGRTGGFSNSMPLQYNSFQTEDIMRNFTFLCYLSLFFAAPPFLASQILTCGRASNDCAVFHYHVQMWNAERRGTSEIFGHNRFSSLDGCEAARKTDEAANVAAIDHLKRAAPRLRAEANRYGPCHCDMTEVRTDPNFLEPAKREAIARYHRGTIMALVANLASNDLTLDSDIILNLTTIHPPPVRQPEKISPIPPPTAEKRLNPEQTALLPTSVAAAAPSGEFVITRQPLLQVEYSPEYAAAEGTGPTASAAAGGNDFVDFELTRIQNIVNALVASDLPEKSELLTVCQSRVLLLTNLRRLAQTAGPRSQLSRRLGTAADESSRLRLVRDLFGGEVVPHWAPNELTRLRFEQPPEISTDPAAVLRDTTNRFAREQRRNALFILLSRSALLSDSEEIWLTDVIHSVITE